MARRILKRFGVKQDLIEEVCDIVGHHHHPRNEETLNFKIIYDADLIVNLEELEWNGKTERLARIIEKNMFTDAGKRLARKTLLGGEK